MLEDIGTIQAPRIGKANAYYNIGKVLQRKFITHILCFLSGREAKPAVMMIFIS